MSALRLAWTTQGVTQAVGTSSPETVASAPDGVDAIEICSVVPRVADAHPLKTAAAATANNIRIPNSPAPRRTNINQKARASEYLSVILRASPSVHLFQENLGYDEVAE